MYFTFHNFTIQIFKKFPLPFLCDDCSVCSWKFDFGMRSYFVSVFTDQKYATSKDLCGRTCLPLTTVYCFCCHFSLYSAELIFALIAFGDNKISIGYKWSGASPLIRIDESKQESRNNGGIYQKKKMHNILLF